jgi:pimeloyl-ACP methyl ester carboxylesterase
LPTLERHHDVLAVTLAGHAGGPPTEGEITDALLADAVERAMDEAGFETAHIVGNSLGGYVALQLASRGRAQTVVALAPAGGWGQGDETYKELLGFQATMLDLVGPPPRTRKRSWPPRRAGAARRNTSPRTSSTFRPSCSPTRCAAPRAAMRRCA